jgi:hypothetical protein
MTGKKQYYKLDDIGFVGTQDKRSDADIRKDIEMTIQFVKERKTEQFQKASSKASNKLAKTK